MTSGGPSPVHGLKTSCPFWTIVKVFDPSLTPISLRSVFLGFPPRAIDKLV